MKKLIKLLLLACALLPVASFCMVVNTGNLDRASYKLMPAGSDMYYIKVIYISPEGYHMKFDYGPFHDNNCTVNFSSAGMNKPTYQTMGNC